jgi:hypothetical protein
MAGSAAVGEPRAEEFPNLVPLPAHRIGFGNGDEPEQRALRFAASTANRGDDALELLGHLDYQSTNSTAASQCVDWTTDRVCARYEPVGKFVWHAAHQHWHFEDFALYELRRFRANGNVHFGPKGLVATSGKISFCVIDVERDGEARSPLYLLPHPLYYSCFTGAGLQGISPGWRDVYSPTTPGQEFPMDDLVPGKLALVIRTDPENRLFETNNKDNVSVAGIEISSNMTEVDVFCVSEPGSRNCNLPPPEETN